jgi:hypothetical protein
MKLIRDVDYMGGGGGWESDIFNKKDDTYISKDLLIKLMMEKYNLSNSDLTDISVVRAKLRDHKIDEII